MIRFLLIAVLICSSCATATRFEDEPIVWRVDDRKPIDKPESRRFSAKRYFADVLVLDRISRNLALPGLVRAANTNAIDEVPDSSWFTNRIGLFDYTPEEVAKGGTTGPAPQPPFLIKSGKSGGGNPGFIAKDSLGRSFLVKFDTPENPEMQTGTNAIVNRFFWAAGYNVPDDYVFFFTEDDLSVAPDAKRTGKYDREEPLTIEVIHEMLADVPRDRTGRVRATASLYLSGSPRGGFPAQGVRIDDANDEVPHERRRELRGLRAIAAWLGHTDMKEDNTLDMYIGEPGQGHLVHYFVDFGESLGAHQAEKSRLEDGWEHVWDWQRNTLAFVTLGLWKRPWEDTKQTPWKSIGAFSSSPFDPKLWREAYPYFPFMDATPPDLYWGAKIVMRFRREHIAAAVAEGQFSEPEAAAYLVQTLIERRDMVGREWIESLTPFDYLEMRDGKVCGIDLAVHYGLATTGKLEILGRRGKRVEDSVDVAEDGAGCIKAPTSAGYHVMRVRSIRADGPRPVMQIHMVGGKNAHILGVVRTEDWE